METILETIGLSHSFGKVKVADNINVKVISGEMIGIVGPNGAGKTSFLNMVTGYIKPNQGTILFLGENITAHSPRSITQFGIARSFQIAQIFNGTTCLENILIAIAAREKQGYHAWNTLMRADWIKEGLSVLERFDLKDYAYRSVEELSEGGRKILDIAISFALRPKLLLLDEPTSGVSTQNKFKIMDVLTQVLSDEKITTIFVEHDMDIVSRYAQRMLVFYNGTIYADDRPEILLARKDLRELLGWE